MKTATSYQAVFFDLDGTLIDSAPGILCSFEHVLKRAGIPPHVPLNESLIGPPLRKTLATLTGITKDDDLDTLVEFFKDSYDSEGYQATRVYEGVEELLASLAGKQFPMAIATNKRLVPTLKILNHLRWKHYFRFVGTLDSLATPNAKKADLIRVSLAELGASAAASVYVGDKWEDGEAATYNHMPFIAAGWGYERWETKEIPKTWQLCTMICDLAEHLTAIVELN